MLEVHRWRHIEWKPSAVVALATSVDGAVVAAARESGAIELWNVAPGSVGWHCHSTIPGKKDAAISSLTWCKGGVGRGTSFGRLFSGGLDGLITEWDLQTLQPKEVVESFGGSVWQLAAEPFIEKSDSGKADNRNASLANGHASLTGSSSDSSSEDDSETEEELPREGEGEQHIAVACDDGCLRLFAVADGQDGMIYRRSFPRGKGKILSVAWSADGSRVFSGGSDGCIHCWDSSSVREVFRITVGIGGGGRAALCVWSLLALRDGTIVSGDSTGSTQFWEGKHGTLIQAYAKHDADVLSLVALPSHLGVYAAGADGQVVLYQHVAESQRARDRGSSGTADLMVGALANKWVYVGKRRAHTHDVRSLAVAFPHVGQDTRVDSRGAKNWQKKEYRKKSGQSMLWREAGTTPMLISGGNDSKLYTYPANSFLAFDPHDICPAPERPYIQLASESLLVEQTLFLVQHRSRVDVWETSIDSHSSITDDRGCASANGHVLGKRKMPINGGNFLSKSKKSKSSLHPNGGVATSDDRYDFADGLEKEKAAVTSSRNRVESAGATGLFPHLVARIETSSGFHICCSAISENGLYVAFSDQRRPRLYRLEPQNVILPSSKRKMAITKLKLPAALPAAQRMQFTSDCTRLLLGSPHQIMVMDVERTKIVHSLRPDIPPKSLTSSGAPSSMKFICTSADSQWLASIAVCGRVHVFNLETLRHHWAVPVLDEGVATSAVFRHGSSNVLVVCTSSNQIHVLDVEARKLSEWSAVNGREMSKRMMEFPGSLIGLSVPPSSTSTTVIAYSSRAMCKIDFSKPLKKAAFDGKDSTSQRSTKANSTSTTNNHGDLKQGSSPRSAKSNFSSLKKNHVDASNTSLPKANGNGLASARNNFVVVEFKYPVLFLGHTGSSSMLVVEKSWAEVLRDFPAPVFRHIYGT